MTTAVPPGEPEQGLKPVPPDQGLTPVPPTDQGLTPVNAPTKSKTPLLVGVGVVIAAIIAVVAAIFH